MACKTVAERWFYAASETPFSMWSSSRPASVRLTAAVPEAYWEKTLHCSYRRLKNPDACHRKPNRPCGRRTLVIHNHGVSSTAIHKASNIHVCRFLPENGTGACQHASKQKGRPAEAGLPCKNLESRISAQQHRRNGKSIQCPSNVTTYIGHTLFVGSALKLFSYFVIMLSNPAIANRNRLMFPIYRNCCFAIARITKMFHHVRNARRVCLIACVCSKNAACRRFILHNERTNVNSC